MHAVIVRPRFVGAMVVCAGVLSTVVVRWRGVCGRTDSRRRTVRIQNPTSRTPIRRRMSTGRPQAKAGIDGPLSGSGMNWFDTAAGAGREAAKSAHSQAS